MSFLNSCTFFFFFSIIYTIYYSVSTIVTIYTCICTMFSMYRCHKLNKFKMSWWKYSILCTYNYHPLALPTHSNNWGFLRPSTNRCKKEKKILTNLVWFLWILNSKKLNVIGCLNVQLDFIYSTCLTNMPLFLTLRRQITRAHPCGIATSSKIDWKGRETTYSIIHISSPMVP